MTVASDSKPVDAQIVTDSLDGRPCVVDEDDLRCPATERLDAHLSGSGKQVDPGLIHNARAEDIEETFLDAIHNRSSAVAGNPL